MIATVLARICAIDPNRSLKRNPDRFPPDFAFHLNRGEAAEAQRSRSQFVILKRGGNVKYLPLAFTEHGATQDRVRRERVAQDSCRARHRVTTTMIATVLANICAIDPNSAT